MSETQATAPIKNDDTAFLDDLSAKTEVKAAPALPLESPETADINRIKLLLPALSDTDRKAVLASLRNT